MNIEYKNQSIIIKDKLRNINVVQSIDPYTSGQLDTFEKGMSYIEKYIKNIIDSNIIYFQLDIYKDEDKVEILKTNENYNIRLKEGTGKLVGNYNIKIIQQEEVKIVNFDFIDGEAAAIVDFHNSGIYELDIDCDFYIGKEKYISIVVLEDDISNYKINNNYYNKMLVIVE